jgi:hypothetical protein
MNRFLSLPFLACAVLIVPPAFAGEISAVPGPDDQGGMLMPMVTIVGADNAANPTSGTLSIAFNPGSVPDLQTLQQWSAGSWFAESAAWRPDIGSPSGVGGTPAANAGSGARFNNQYGFMFMAMPMLGMANIPAGKSLGIRLTAISSGDLESFNYVNGQNRWDAVFPSVGSQVLWNGSMWHNYFTLPAAAATGSYTATFEVFIANLAFTGTTGFAQYDTAALNAVADGNFTPASVTYTWNAVAVPEPSTLVLAGAAVAGLACIRSRSRRGAAA